MANEEVKGRDKILTGIDQRMVNQRGLLQIEIEIMPLEMIEENKDASDAVKKDISKKTA